MNLIIINDEVVAIDAMKREIDWSLYGIEEVFVAFDAEEAKKKILGNPIDIMLCDIEMPGDNGIQLLQWVRSKKMDIDCVFLICHANFEYAQEAIKLGCMNYVLVPAEYEDIGEAVYKVVMLRKQKVEQEQLKKYGEQWVSEKKEKALEEQGSKKSHPQIVKECKEYILKRLDREELSVNELADLCHLNAIYLNRLFKQKTGISINQYIIHERMILAARLLEDGELSANTVSARVGYPNYPHFSATFKKHFGCSPKQYIVDKSK